MGVFRVGFHVADDVLVVDVRGEVDLGNQHQLERAILWGMDRGPVVVDLSRMTFMDISVLHCMSRCARAAERTGRPLVFAAPSRPVARLLTVAGMLDQLPLTQSVDAGLEAVRLDTLWNRATADDRV